MKLRAITTVVVTGMGSVLCAWGGETQSTAQAEWLAGYVPPSALEKTVSPPKPQQLKDSLRWEKWERTDRGARLGQSRRDPTAGELWTKFEEEYTPRQRYHSVIQDSLMGAKYKLDRTVFAIDQFVEESEKAFEFEYNFSSNAKSSTEKGKGGSGRRARRHYANPWEDICDNARFKTDINLGLSDNFVGVRLDFPIGD
jgi:hypothetical protein